jgi:hypothetical protein
MMVFSNRYDHRLSLQFARSWQVNQLLPAYLPLGKKVSGKDKARCSQASKENPILPEGYRIDTRSSQLQDSPWE